MIEAGLNDLFDGMVKFATTTLGVDKITLKAWFAANHMGPLWDLLRDYLLNPQVMIIYFIPLLFLERLIPAEKPKKLVNPHLAFDFLFPLMRLVLTLGLIPVGYAFMKSMYDTYLPFLNTGILDGKPMWLQIIGAFAITDFMFWFSHYLRHKIPWLWYFHTIHHSQKHLNPMSTQREHAFEGYINFLIRTAPIAFVGGSYPAWIWFGFLNQAWGFFIHSNLKINLGPLKYIIVSPQFHRVHHSIRPEHWDMNYGERLTLWDWMFGTMVKDMDVYPETGVAHIEHIEENSVNPLRLCWTWLKQFAYPFVMIFYSIKRKLLPSSDTPLVGGPNTDLQTAASTDVNAGSTGVDQQASS
jgi:sterol desaturase/sphingolipid hydroxylase (fatty acid hydroxylase superfamily)